MVGTATPRRPAGGARQVGSPDYGWRDLRRTAAVGTARIVASLVGVAHHQGTALPGMAAERVWPTILSGLAGQLGATVLVVGTNGKTTTAGMIARIVERTDRLPIANRSGANMRQGIVTSLVAAADLRGRLQAIDRRPRGAVFEVDELALEQILPELGPCIIVATNLFRDQLDRYGEADAVVDRWATALESASSATNLVYCADDPRLAMLAAGTTLRTLTFGLAGALLDRPQGPDSGDPISDPVACRVCGRQLVYDWRSIGHLGAFACPKGHLGRRRPDVSIQVWPDPNEGAPTALGADVRFTGRFGAATARPALSGLTGAYNTGAAVTAGLALGLDVARCAEAVEGFVSPFGRLERIHIDGRNLVLVLIKNTVSLAETVHLGPRLGAEVVLLAINDAPADGRDVSWIWDAPMAELVADRAVVLCGSRAADLRLRLRYDSAISAAPPSSIAMADSLAGGLADALARTPPGGTLIAAATYTAMMGLRSIAERQGDAPPAPR